MVNIKVDLINYLCMGEGVTFFEGGGLYLEWIIRHDDFQNDGKFF